MNENWRYGYSNDYTSRIYIYFSVNAIVFPHIQYFCSCCLKIVFSSYFDVCSFLFRKSHCFIEKWRGHSFFPYNNKYIYKFQVFTIKTDTRNMSKWGSLFWKIAKSMSKPRVLWIIFIKKQKQQSTFNYEKCLP